MYMLDALAKLVLNVVCQLLGSESTILPESGVETDKEDPGWWDFIKTGGETAAMIRIF